MKRKELNSGSNGKQPKKSLKLNVREEDELLLEGQRFETKEMVHKEGEQKENEYHCRSIKSCRRVLIKSWIHKY